MKKKNLFRVISATLISSMLLSMVAYMPTRAAGVKKLTVEYHTQQEIADFVKAHSGEAAQTASYKITPSTSSPYVIGRLSDETLKGAVDTLNSVRYIAGVPANVTIDDGYTQKAQGSTLVNAKNKVMTHYPTQPSDMPDDIYEICKTGGSSCNIAWGYGTLYGVIIYGWMSDSNSSNIDRLGHRRWCLNPTMAKTGFGKTDSYTAMYAFDRSNNTDIDSVVWPAQNTPIQYFSYADPWNFSSKYRIESAKVTLTNKKTGKVYNFSDSQSDGYFNIDNANYGMPGCIVFRPNDYTDVDAGTVYTVDIKGTWVTGTDWVFENGEWNRVDIGGDFEYQYDVNFFDINNPNKEVPPADESQVTEFVTRLYTKCLGRNPEAEGLKNWTNQLVNRKIDGATVGAGFVFSEEYQSKGVSRQEFVQMLYRVFMGREADQAGLDYWLNNMKNGMTREQVFKGFVDSDEYTSICKDYGITRGNYNLKGIADPRTNGVVTPQITAYVERIYVKALGRPSDPSGIEYWSKEIADEVKEPVWVAELFIFSPEFEGKNYNDTEYIKVLYRTFMGREFDEAGLNYWIGELNKGRSRRDVLESFAGCPEFQEIIKSFGL